MRQILLATSCFIILAMSGAQAQMERTAELPPNAKPGECYARLFIAPTYRTITDQVLVRPAGERVETTQPRYEWVEERVLVKEASERIEVIPAKYATRQETVLVKPASEQLVAQKAVYDTVQERVLVRAAYTTWKKGRGPIEKIDQATGEIMCLVEVPAEYKTVTKTVLKTPETTKKIPIPAEYAQVNKTVMVDAPRTNKIAIPAEYKTVKVRKLVEPAAERRIPIAAEYRTVTREEKVTDGRVEWRPILCETNARPGLVTDIQRALLAAGHNPGPIDGRIGSQTMAAVGSFQRARGLATGQLSIETLRALNVNLTR